MEQRKMLLKIIDDKEIGTKQWFLCCGTLLDYLRSLSLDFTDYHIQRKIVKNVYLDNIYQSIVDGEPMPTVTLVYYGKRGAEDFLQVKSSQFEILDGLQRTFRLWVVMHIFDMVNSDSSLVDAVSVYRKIKESSEEIALQNADFVTLKYIKMLFEDSNGKKRYKEIVDAYINYTVYFYVWGGLDEKEVVKKMLILNAGQKSVSSVHQYELLFLHFFENQRLYYDEHIKLFREKDHEYNKIKRGDNRACGQYCLSSIVVALQSFIEGKPLRIAPTNQVGSVQADASTEDVINESYFSRESLSSFINQIYELDLYYSKQGEEYVKWFAKDTTLSGILAAVGKYCQENNEYNLNTFKDLILEKKIDYALGEFYVAYGEMSSVHSNVGQVVRNAIFNYTYKKLNGVTVKWDDVFLNER